MQLPLHGSAALGPRRDPKTEALACTTAAPGGRAVAERGKGSEMMDVACATFEDERQAARVVDGLLGSGFPPSHIYAVVERQGRLCRAPVGRSYRIAYAALIGAALAAAVGGCLATLAAWHGVIPPSPHTPGARPPADALLALAPSAVVGAIIGAAVGALRWHRRELGFPASAPGTRAFVAVRVSHGNVGTAERVLRTDGRRPYVAQTDDPVHDASHALNGFVQRELAPMMRRP
jgi:hypothetical protein